LCLIAVNFLVEEHGSEANKVYFAVGNPAEYAKYAVGIVFCRDRITTYSCTIVRVEDRSFARAREATSSIRVDGGSLFFKHHHIG